MNDLFSRSAALIRANQHAGGAYVASPTFPNYQYCWFRDSTYIAYALDLAGDHISARRFYDWAAAVVLARQAQIERVLAADGAPPQADLLHTRYTLEGANGGEDWPNFQLDGFGTLIWGMERHLALANAPLPDEWRTAIELLARYLAKLWRLPCYDCWEEFADKVHTATLAALYGGLRTAAELLGTDGAWAADVAADIRAFVLDNCVQDGSLCKFVGNPAVDASLLHVATPYRLLEPDDPLMRRTVARIEADLRADGGGVHRYADDNYYGGGEWILLTAYLGWYYTELGETERANDLLTWITSRANGDGLLPEQVAEHLIYPDMLAEWEQSWGKSACPLLWSHAAYMTLALKLDPSVADVV